MFNTLLPLSAFSFNVEAAQDAFRLLQETSVPWRAIFTSKVVWACCVSDFCFIFGLQGATKTLPLYMEEVMLVDISTVRKLDVVARVFTDFSGEIFFLKVVLDVKQNF